VARISTDVHKGLIQEVSYLNETTVLAHARRHAFLMKCEKENNKKKEVFVMNLTN